MPADRVTAPPMPGEILRRRLKAETVGIRQDDLAEALKVTRLTVNQILNGKSAITPDMALRLEAVLGTSPRMWLKLQAEYDLYAARRKLGEKLDQMPRLASLKDGPPA